MTNTLDSKYHGCRLQSYRLKGHDVVSIENSLVRLTVLLSKGADITEFRFKPFDIDVLWHSKRELPNLERFIPETAQGWDSFFDFFVGGWQESFPTGNTVGAHRLGQGTLHGEVSILPWEYEIISQSKERIEVRFFVECRRNPFRLERRISLNEGEAQVAFDETITNLSPLELEYAWGHHPSFGAPFLSEACVLDLPAGNYSTRERSEISQPRLMPDQKSDKPIVKTVDGDDVDLRSVPGADSGTWDNFEVALSSAEPGRVAIRNPDLGFGFGMSWDREAFPYLWEWEVCSGWPNYPLWGREYLLALEPFNCPIGGGLHNLAGKGVLPVLKPGEHKSTRFEFGFCSALNPFEGQFLKSDQIGIAVKK
ncbi:MAG: DUF4432 family protein [Opitutales bacterium]|nr:DUF4432 family protein [Opitutales bacterium]